MKELFFWDSVLAGRYVTGCLDRLVTHAVALVNLCTGRVRRKKGQTLCNRIKPEHMSTSGVSGNSDAERCALCEELATKMTAAGEEGR